MSDNSVPLSGKSGTPMDESLPYDHISRAQELLGIWKYGDTERNLIAQAVIAKNHPISGDLPSEPVLLLARCIAPEKRPDAELLRELFIIAYQQPDIPMLALAWHLTDAQPNTFSAQRGRAIYMPLTTLYGLWKIRRELGQRYLTLCEQGRAKQLDLSIAKYCQKFADSFLRFHAACLDVCGDGIQVDLHRPSAFGTDARHFHHGLPVALEDVSSMVLIDIVTATDEPYACYQVLAALHRQWRHRDASVQSNFGLRDTVYHPRFNGYRALRTTLIAPEFSGTPVIVKIATPEMALINERGYLGARELGFPDGIGWWTGLTSAPPHRHRSKSYIMVFSRDGEKIAVEEGNTALDFAFHVHSEVAAQARGIRINGQRVSLGHVLEPNDLVNVDIDRGNNYVQPHWLQDVKNATSRQKIRHVLRHLPTSLSVGQQRIWEELLSECDKVGVTINHDEFNQALQDLAREWYRESVGSLEHDALEDPADAQAIAQAILARHLAPLIVTPDQQPMYAHIDLAKCWAEYRHDALRELSHYGRVAPGEPIVGDVIESYPPVVVVHRTGCRCRPKSPSGQWKPLAWRAVGSQEYLINITAIDRAALLRPILETIWHIGAAAQDGLRLRQVNASADEKHQASIELLVHAEDDSLKDHFEHELIEICQRERATYTIMQHYPHMDIPALPGMTPYQVNPYALSSTQVPYLFFGRDQQFILLWRELLATIDPAHTARGHLFTLRGPARIGKTSFFKQLQYRANRDKLPLIVAYVESSGEIKSDCHEIARSLEKACRERLGDRVPPAPAFKSFTTYPMHTLALYIDALAPLLDGQRLVILYDEFTRIAEHSGGNNDRYLVALQSLVEQRAFFAVLLGIHPEIELGKDGQRLALTYAKLIDGAHQIPLSLFSPQETRQYVTEPLRQRFAFDESYVSALWDATHGHPYLLTILCHYIIQHALDQAQTHLTATDVNNQVQHIINAPNTYFLHFTNFLSPLQQNVMSVAAAVATKGSSQLQAIRKELTLFQRCTSSDIHQALRALVKLELIEFQSEDPNSGEISIKVPLLAWVLAKHWRQLRREILALKDRSVKSPGGMAK